MALSEHIEFRTHARATCSEPFAVLCIASIDSRKSMTDLDIQ